MSAESAASVQQPIQRRKLWMTSMINKQKTSIKDLIKYRELDQQIRNACQIAKEKMVNEQCMEIDLEEKEILMIHVKTKRYQ